MDHIPAYTNIQSGNCDAGLHILYAWTIPAHTKCAKLLTKMEVGVIVHFTYVCKFVACMYGSHVGGRSCLMNDYLP